jgi:hypothetical protein
MTSLELDLRLKQHQGELTVYCYRMLGSAFEAEDPVQETLVRAWRSLGRFDEGRASLRSWLYAIATNVCLDMLRSTQRRARAMDLGPSSYAGAPLGAPLPETAWLQPLPDSVLAMGGDPAALAVERETRCRCPRSRGGCEAAARSTGHYSGRTGRVTVLVWCRQSRTVRQRTGSTCPPARPAATSRGRSWS